VVGALAVWILPDGRVIIQLLALSFLRDRRLILRQLLHIQTIHSILENHLGLAGL
jgi:hypothetical protein